MSCNKTLAVCGAAPGARDAAAHPKLAEREREKLCGQGASAQLGADLVGQKMCRGARDEDAAVFLPPQPFHKELPMRKLLNFIEEEIVASQNKRNVAFFLATLAILWSIFTPIYEFRNLLPRCPTESLHIIGE